MPHLIIYIVVGLSWNSFPLEGWDGASCVLCFLHFSLGISLLAAGYLSVLILFSNLRSHQANGYIPCAITVANPQASFPRIEMMFERLIVAAFGHMSVFSWRTFVVFLTVGGDRSVGRIGVIGVIAHLCDSARHVVESQTVGFLASHVI